MTFFRDQLAIFPFSVKNYEFHFPIQNAKFRDFVHFPSKTILLSPYLYGLQWPKEGDKHPTYALEGHDTLYLTIPIKKNTPGTRVISRPKHWLSEYQGSAWGLFSRDWGETKTLKPETESRPRHWQFKPRWDRDQGFQNSRLRRGRSVPTPRQDWAEALLRLETASRLRRQDRGHIPGKFPCWKVDNTDNEWRHCHQTGFTS